jgi:hypothetical protein
MRMNIPLEQKSSQQLHIPELKPSLEVSSLDLLMMMETIEPSDNDFSAAPTAAPEARPKRGHA